MFYTSVSSQPAEDLIKEIAILELEVVYLEKCLLSMYRKTFDERASILSTFDENSYSNSAMNKSRFPDHPGHHITRKESGHLSGSMIVENSSIHRSHSSLSQHSACSFRTYPPMGTLSKAVNSYHSLPLSMLEVKFTRNTYLNSSMFIVYCRWGEQMKPPSKDWFFYHASTRLDLFQINTSV